MFAKNEATSIEEYMALVPDDRKDEFELLHKFIQKAVPELKPFYATNMIGYGTFYYLDSKNQKKAWPIISLANQKKYISIYVCTIIEDKTLAAKIKEDFGKLSKGVSCIRFQSVKEINMDTLKTVLKIAAKKPGVAGARVVEG